MKAQRIYMAVLLVFLILFSGCLNSRNLSKDAYISGGAQTIPPEYIEVINDYKKIVNYRLSDSFEDDYNKGHFIELNGEWTTDLWSRDESSVPQQDVQYKWHCMLVDMLDYIEVSVTSSFGYILMDINEDSSPELFWVSADYSILAIFTISDGHVKIVDAYFPGYKCVILNNGELFTLRRGGAGDYEYTLARLDPDADNLFRIERKFGRNNSLYFDETDGNYCIISKEEYEELCTMYPFVISDKWRANIIQFLEG